MVVCIKVINYDIISQKCGLKNLHNKNKIPLVLIGGKSVQFRKVMNGFHVMREMVGGIGQLDCIL